jgi:NADH-quinone oxidoreductase subunit F
MLTAAEVAVGKMDFESAMNQGTFLGSGGTVVLDEGDDIVDATLNVAGFYANETCGQCTPCREGCRWMEEILRRFQNGTALPDDIDLLLDVTGHIEGNTICAFGDGAAAPIASAVRKFRDEFEARTGVGALERQA